MRLAAQFWITTPLTLLLVASETRAVASPQGARPNTLAFNKPLNPYDAGVVERVKSGAAKKLQDAECLKVLADFKDDQGRSLDKNLEPWSLSAADYLQRLPFRDGSWAPPCRRRSVEMVTAVGLPRVYVCPAGVADLNSRLAQVETQNPSLAEAMVIHEMLHSLGLGENPPSTFEITEQVRRRCH
jgi:hypothetical protein